MTKNLVYKERNYKIKLFDTVSNSSIKCFLTDEDVVVDAHSKDQQREAEKLQRVEGLPTDGQRNCPDYQSSNRVQHHSVI